MILRRICGFPRIDRGIVLFLFIILVMTSFSSISEAGDNVSADPGKHIVQVKLHSSTSIIIRSDEELVAQGWPGTGTSDDPFRITGLNISVNEDANGIDISNTTSHIVVKDCLITGADPGFGAISITDSQNITIENCIITDNDHGVYVTNGRAIDIINNHIFENRQFGIVLAASYNCMVINNRIYENNNFAVDMGASHSCIIENNTIEEHRNGVNFSEAWENIVRNNMFFNNSNDAVYLYSSSQRNMLYNNSIIASGRYGAFAQSITAFNNSFINNRFIGNRVSHAVDDSSFNRWDDGPGYGNQWDNYSGYGPYLIEGMSNSSDSFPTRIDYPPIIVREPGNVSLQLGQTDRFLTWIVAEATPANYTLSLNDNLIESANWSSWSPITVDPLAYITSVGNFRITITLKDQTGHVVNHTVYVSVEGLSTDVFSLWLGIGMIGLALGSTILFVFWYRKRTNMYRESGDDKTPEYTI